MIPNEHEIKVLRMLNGEIDLPWGSWVGACIEFLQENGYVTHGILTAPRLGEKGKKFLEDLDNGQNSG